MVLSIKKYLNLTVLSPVYAYSWYLEGNTRFILTGQDKIFSLSGNWSVYENRSEIDRMKFCLCRPWKLISDTFWLLHFLFQNFSFTPMDTKYKLNLSDSRLHGSSLNELFTSQRIVELLDFR